ncbi:MAG TPA: type II toxin-antitoxin system VapC family toxin [Gemmataceae bacterium]|jgi:predicted nucleic acid-binding protein
MKYVLDSSVAFKWVVTEALSDKAQAVRDDYRNNLHELLSPDIFPIEIAHALTRAERQGRLTAPQSGVLLADVLNTAPKLFPSLPLLRRAVEISSQLRIGVYDCLYIALAEQEGSELLTADGRLASLKPTFPFITELSSLP